METQAPAQPSQQTETQMDEFEATSKTLQKSNRKNILKLVKIAGIGFVVVFLVAVGIFALHMMSQGQTRPQTQQTPAASIVGTSSPSPTPQIQYPEEFTKIDNKINAYEREITGPQDERNKLNYPSMNINFTF